MKQLSQDKISLLGLVNNRLSELGWKKEDLAKHCPKESRSAIFRFLNGSEQISVNNISYILQALDLLKTTEHVDILNDLQSEKAEKPDIDTINARVGKGVEQLTRILLSGDANITRALLTALDSFVFYQRKSQAMKSRLENTDNTIKEVKRILQENLPPDGVEERRRCWVKMRELLA